jgi:ketosteroid isomerase-like protein
MKEMRMSSLAQDFVDALAKLEESGDAAEILALFDPNASVSNPVVADQKNGGDSAERFWRDYRGSFDEIRSQFRHVTSQDNTSFLEWQSSGKIDGQPFSYDGVSVLEEKDGRIVAFRSYFDPAKLPTGHAASGDRGGRAAEGQPSEASAGHAEGSAEAGNDLDRAQEELAEQRAQGGYA